MCGILLLVQDEAAAQRLSDDAFETGLTARGPDHCGAVQVRLPFQSSISTPACCCLSLHMAASLLQLRGSSPSTSPLADAQGNTLCFNGEIFSGLDIPQGGNDGKALLAALQQASSAGAAAAGGSACEDIVAVLSKLRGPWALIYWQAQQQTLWFGRDVMGKRSLLLRHQHGCLVLTSVTPQQQQQQQQEHAGAWIEVPPGLYSISAHDLHSLLHGASADSSSSSSSGGGGGGSAATSAAGRTSTVPAVLRPAPGAEVAGQGAENPSNGGVGSAADLCLVLPGLQQHPWMDEQLQQLQHYQRSSDADTAASAAVSQQQGQQEPSQLSAALKQLQLQLQEEGRQQGQQQGVHQWQEPPAVAEQRPDPSQQQQPQQQQQLEAASQQLLHVMQAAVDVRCLSINTLQQQASHSPSAAGAVGTNTPGALPPAPMLVLFSGGVDSTLIAALAHRALPSRLPIDLSTVCFDGGRSADRVAARAAVLELAAYAPDRAWRLIEVDSSLEEVDSIAQHIKGLLHPAATVMDWNIGSALWLAAKAEGRVWVPVFQPLPPPAPQQQQADPAAEQAWQLQEVSVAGGSTAGVSPAAQGQQGQAAQEQPQQQPQAASGLYKSAARVVLLGHGADEQCGGYGRHRTRFRLAGLPGVAEELALDVKRLWLRNLGRDDRLIADHAREGRHPFLDEDVMSFLQQLPLSCMVDYSKPPGVGDKRILRHLLASLGLTQAAGREKRAIQFGTRLAALSNKRDFGSNRKANMRQAGSLKMVAQRSAPADS